LARTGRLPIVFAALLLVSALAVACGGEAGGAGTAPSGETGFLYQKITPLDRTLTIDDLMAGGFKKSKTYNVRELPEAESAYFGFFGLDPYDRFDYEARFYGTHADAVEHGTWWAEQRVGKNAPLTEADAPWKEGLKDARSCKGDLASGPASHGIQACTSPKYFEYAIYGNMILLCQGQDEKQAQDNCRVLLQQVEQAGSAGG